MTPTAPQEQMYLIKEKQLKLWEIDLDTLDEECTRVDMGRNIEISREAIADTRSRPVPLTNEPKFNSTDLILLANDEWKRREERHHRHENTTWCAGFINGFLTDKKWAREYLDKLLKERGQR